MASSKPGSFRFSSKDAKNVMASRAVQKAAEKMADVGIAAFRKEAAGTSVGDLADKVRREPARGWDGRPANGSSRPPAVTVGPVRHQTVAARAGDGSRSTCDVAERRY
ncbi:hypothetical protein GS887_27685 [Rhodococcus hoagii]|nr:hypothetical protein [Prescottella equi]